MAILISLFQNELSFDYKDIFEDGDEVVKALEDLTGNKKMVAKDGSIIETVQMKKALMKLSKRKCLKTSKEKDRSYLTLKDI